RKTDNKQTRGTSRECFRSKNDEERAASKGGRRPPRQKRPQKIESATRTAVTQNASQVRWMADIPRPALCSRIVSSTASTKVLTKGAGFPIIIGVPRQWSDP